MNAASLALNTLGRGPVFGLLSCIRAFPTKPYTFKVLIWFDDKVNPIRKAVVRREWRYKLHCCRPGLRVSSLGARFAVPRQSVPLRHKKRPKCEESLDRYYPRAHSLARLIERRVYHRGLNRPQPSRATRRSYSAHSLCLARVEAHG